MTANQILGSYDFSPRFLRLFAVASAKYLISKSSTPYPASFKAINVAERYAHGLATEEELSEAYHAAAGTKTYYYGSLCYVARWNAKYAAADAVDALGMYLTDESLPILLNQIKRLSELEKVILDIPKDLY